MTDRGTTLVARAWREEGDDLPMPCALPVPLRQRSRGTHRAGSDESSGRCVTCGQEFRAARCDRAYCSPACRQYAYRRRKADAPSAAATVPPESAARFKRTLDRLLATALTESEQHLILCELVGMLTDHEWHWIDGLIAGTRLGYQSRAAARAAEGARVEARSTLGKLEAGRRVLADAAASALGCEKRGRGLTTEYRLPRTAWASSHPGLTGAGARSA